MKRIDKPTKDTKKHKMKQNIINHNNLCDVVIFVGNSILEQIQ
jgi:hypothetical protein